MGFRLKTSKKTKDLFENLSKSSSLKPFALCKIAIALSLNEDDNIDNYMLSDINGMELQRSTVTGEYDILYKSLIEMNLNRSLSEDEYYPHYMKLHIDRGTEILAKRYQYAGNSLEKFLSSILVKGDAL